MWVCPVCKKQNEAGPICAGCGFDESGNYERYCTLTVVDLSACSPGGGEGRRYGWEDVYRRGIDCLAIGDHEAAVRYLKLAAENGNADAQFTYGSLYYGGCAGNHREAAGWFQKAALQGHPLAQYYLGRCYFWGEGLRLDYTEGVRWLEESRKGGCREAEDFLEAQVYGQAGGTGLNVYNWYRMLAERGNVDAQIYLGDYYGSFGVPGGYAEAARWYERAADAGSASGKWKIGACYYSGQGVEQDQEKAVGYYRMAALEGDSMAQALLGMCYEFGNGAEKDLQKAVMWYREAASGGNKEAQKRVDALLKK